MTTEALIKLWFEKWQQGRYTEIPVAEAFIHRSPFGVIRGVENYLKLVRENEDKFLGQTFTITDAIYQEHKACVRYIAHREPDFSLAVSEWYYIKDGQIAEVVSYYHLGEIRAERKLKDLTP